MHLRVLAALTMANAMVFTEMTVLNTIGGLMAVLGSRRLLAGQVAISVLMVLERALALHDGAECRVYYPCLV